MNTTAHPNAVYRQELLVHLYTARAAKPADGWVNVRVLEACAPPPGACADTAFALDVLIELGLVKRNGFTLRITGPGVLAFEAAWG